MMKHTALVLISLSLVAAEDLKLSSRSDSPVRAKRSTAAAEDLGFVAAPIAGYSVREGPLEVRALLGVPGATHYSAPFSLPEAANSIVSVPGQGWLLVLRAEEAASVWIPESGFEQVLPKVEGAPDLTAFSHDGASLALYFKANARLFVYTGLPDKPELAADLATVVWPDDVTALAITRDGNLVAGVTAAGETFVLAAHGTAMHRLLAEGASASTLEFWGEHLVFLDTAGERVLGVERPLQGTAAREIAVLGSETPSPSARIVRGDGASLLVAEGPAGRVVRIDARVPGEPTGLLSSVEAGAFSEARTLRGRGSLLLSGNDGAASRILASDGESIGIHYVPAIAPREETAEEGQIR
jgi:hypothetical protein